MRNPAHQTTDFVLYGLGGARLEDGVSLVGGDLANRGTTLTEIGATAISGNVVSNGDVYLRSGGRIDGYVEIDGDSVRRLRHRLKHSLGQRGRGGGK